MQSVTGKQIKEMHGENAREIWAELCVISGCGMVGLTDEATLALSGEAAEAAKDLLNKKPAKTANSDNTQRS